MRILHLNTSHSAKSLDFVDTAMFFCGIVGSLPLELLLSHTTARLLSLILNVFQDYLRSLCFLDYLPSNPQFGLHLFLAL
jgi:hypothetical protein